MTSCTLSEFQSNQKISKLQESDIKILVPNGSLVNSIETSKNNINYLLGYNSNFEIEYIMPIDNKFSINGLNNKSTLNEILKNNNTEIIKIPGWLPVVNIKNDWYAAFDDLCEHNVEDTVKFFFKYNF